MTRLPGIPVQVLAYDTYRDSVIPRRIQIEDTERNVEEVLDTTIEEMGEGDRFRTFLVRVEGGERLRLAYDVRRHTWMLLEREPADPCRS